MGNEENKNVADELLSGAAKEQGAKEQGIKEQGAKQQPKRGDVVEIEKNTLQDLLGAMNSMKDEIKMLKEISDKSRLFNWQNKQSGGSVIKEARVCKFEDKYVVAWKKVEDKSGYRDGRLVVDQRVALFLVDKNIEKGKGSITEPEIKEVDYHYWSQNSLSETGEVVGEATDKHGTFWEIQMEDGYKIKLDISFINAF